jgi:hypothetical protein
VVRSTRTGRATWARKRYVTDPGAGLTLDELNEILSAYQKVPTPFNMPFNQKSWPNVQTPQQNISSYTQGSQIWH